MMSSNNLPTSNTTVCGINYITFASISMLFVPQTTKEGTNRERNNISEKGKNYIPLHVRFVCRFYFFPCLCVCVCVCVCIYIYIYIYIYICVCVCVCPTQRGTRQDRLQTQQLESSTLNSRMLVGGFLVMWDTLYVYIYCI
jgi:hypothetical protein